MANWLDPYRDRSNPYWPLPKDYSDLSAEGQRLARLSVLCNHTTPVNLVIAWYFFCKVYLAQTKEAVYFKKGYQESPNFHFGMVYDMGQYGRNAYAAPRGSAKSTVITEEMTLLLSLTKSFYEITLAQSTDRLVMDRFDTIMNQLQQNELIRADFGVMQPKRGQALWNHGHLALTNGSIIRGLSVMGKKRGGRPKLFILDDPENDPDSDSEQSRTAVIEKFETIMFKQIIPMMESGSSVFWIGTLIDRKSFLYRAVTGDDERFDFWNRKVLKAITIDKEDPNKFHVLWPAKWPKEVLDARRDEIGPSAYASEYLNEPISAQERILTVDPRKNEYSVDSEFDWGNPLNHSGLVHWQERVFEEGSDHRIYKEREKPFHELVRPMFRAILFDYASGLSTYNDYSCIATVGFDTLGTLWVLSLWLGRAKDATLYRLIYETGLAWRPRVIGIEAVGHQKSFAEAFQEYIREQEEMRGDSWRARVYPVTYPAKETKAGRIASLEWRFDSGRIKYPSHLAGDWPYTELYAQTHDFTIDLALLQHDDAIDTVAMSKYVVKTKGGRFKRERGVPSLLERIVKGKSEAKGQPLLSGVSSSWITDEMLDVMTQKENRKLVQPPQRRIERIRDPRLDRRRPGKPKTNSAEEGGKNNVV